jgi:hypothetical protein
MKINELISHLQKQPQDAEVRVVTGDGSDDAWAFDVGGVAALPDASVAVFAPRVGCVSCYDTTKWPKPLTDQFFSTLAGKANVQKDD